MRKISILLLLLFTFLVSRVNAQYARASLWTNDMQAFASQDAINGIQKNVVLFAGSSTFRMWSSLKSDFPNSPVLNRAFGGSWMSDLIYYFDQVVEPYNPSQVVLYEGDNDLHETSKTVDEFFDDLVTMTRLINIYYPNAKILLVSIKPSPSRTISFEKYKAANALMKTYADKVSYIEYADLWTPMLKGDGTPDSSLFGSDLLHMNASGYALWKTILEPYLLKGTAVKPSSDKLMFDESSNATYHEYSWVNVTAPSLFTTIKAEKISCDSNYYHNGNTSLKIAYQGMSGGDWKACVAAANWAGYNITDEYNLDFWVYSKNAVSSADLPNIYLESITGTTTNEILMSDYISSIPSDSWIKVSIPVNAWKNQSPSFSFDNVKTIFFSQQNLNSQTVELYIDDIIYTAVDTIPAVSNGEDIYIDYGSNVYASNGNWNDITDTQSAKSKLIDLNGATTGITLEITDPFYVGYNTNGAPNATDDASEFVPTASQDNFFGHGMDWGSTPANPVGEIKFSGLDPNKSYSFSFFASRMVVTDNREALYSLSGKDGAVNTATLDASNNTSHIALVSDVKPTNDSIITLKVEAGPNNTSSTKFFYLGAMKIATSGNPNAIGMTVKNRVPIYYSNETLHLGENTGSLSIFDLSGKIITEGNVINGKCEIRLNNGVYLARINDITSKFVVD